jgi:cell wall-associated NlpC family hydrolase
MDALGRPETADEEAACALVDALRAYVQDDPPGHSARVKPARKRARSHRRGMGAPSPRLLSAAAWDAVRLRPVPSDDAVVREAQRHLGAPYRWGGVQPSRGVDCSGFAWHVYRKRGRTVPLSWFRDSRFDPRQRPSALERHGMRHVQRPRPGDVVVFGRQHVGIVVGEVSGRALFIGANHGGPDQGGRVDIMPVDWVGPRPVYYRYAPSAPNRRSRRPSTRE